jgi:hypothetical protein
MRYRVRTTYYGGVKNNERIVEQVISLEPFCGSRINRIEERDERVPRTSPHKSDI